MKLRRANPAYYGKKISELSSYQRAAHTLTDRYIELFVWHKNNRHMQERKKHFIRNLRMEIYEIGKMFTGEISVQAYIALKDHGKSPTKEHRFNRAKSSTILFDALGEWSHFKLSTNKLVELIVDSCMIHYTTPDENKHLELFQNDPDLQHLNPDEIYEQAGVKKILKPSTTKKIFVIDDIIYSSVQQVAKVYGLTMSQVNRNVADNNLPNWIKETECDNFYRNYVMDKHHHETIDHLNKDGLLV